MKKNRTAIIIIAIAVILIIVLLVIKNSNKPEEQQPLPQQPTENVVEEKYVEVQNDGTKVNVSDKLAQAKKIDGLEISNIRLTEKDNVSLLLADIKNPTNEARGDFAVTLTILDDAGKELASVSAYVAKVEPGATAVLNTSTTADFANAYDFKVEKK